MSGLLDANEDAATSWAAPLTALMREVTVQVTAELGSSTLSLRDLTALKVGDVVRLDRDPESPIVLFVEGTPKLIGTPTRRVDEGARPQGPFSRGPRGK